MNASTSSKRQSWQSRPITQILAVCAFVPLYVFGLWTNLSERTITLKELFLYPLLLGGGGVILVLLLFRFGAPDQHPTQTREVVHRLCCRYSAGLFVSRVKDASGRCAVKFNAHYLEPTLRRNNHTFYRYCAQSASHRHLAWPCCMDRRGSVRGIDACFYVESSLENLA